MQVAQGLTHLEQGQRSTGVGQTDSLRRTNRLRAIARTGRLVGAFGSRQDLVSVHGMGAVLDAGMRRGNNRAAPGAMLMMDRRVQRSVRAVKARAVTVEARRGEELGCVVLAVLDAAVCDYEAARRGGGRGHRAMVNMGSEETGGETDGRGDCSIYIHTGISSALRISIAADGRAPPICLERGRISRPLDKQARETIICVGSALLRQCAPGFGRCFDGETHPSSSTRSEKRLKQTCPFHPRGGFPIDAS